MLILNLIQSLESNCVNWFLFIQTLLPSFFSVKVRISLSMEPISLFFSKLGGKTTNWRSNFGQSSLLFLLNVHRREIGVNIGHFYSFWGQIIQPSLLWVRLSASSKPIFLLCNALFGNFSYLSFKIFRIGIVKILSFEIFFGSSSQRSFLNIDLFLLWSLVILGLWLVRIVSI